MNALLSHVIISNKCLYKVSIIPYRTKLSRTKVIGQKLSDKSYRTKLSRTKVTKFL